MDAVAGKRVLLTGAGGGFGRAARKLLERHGAHVVGIDLEHGEGVELACDVTDRRAVEEAVAAAVDRLGRLDVVVNNAGIGTAGPIGSGFDSGERAVLEVNLVGAWHVSAAALPHLLASDGQLVNVASLLAVVNLPYAAAYSASKRALGALGDALRLEHGDRIAVTTVYPGYVPTAIHSPAEERAGVSMAGIAPEETVDDAARAIVRAIERRPRDTANTAFGALVLRVARAAPRLVELFVRRRARRAGVLPVRAEELRGERVRSDGRPTSDAHADTSDKRRSAVG